MKFALVTGASSGIGKALAIELARRGASVILVARSADKLRALAEVLTATRPSEKQQFPIFPIDLSKPGSCRELFDWTRAQGFRIDTLVNNAGIGIWGDFSETKLEDQLGVIELNISALVSLTHLFLPDLKVAQPGYLLNVASIAAYQAVPSFGIYAASKSFVLSFTRSLYHELKSSRVIVSALLPGATESQFIAAAGMNHMEDKAKKFNMTSQEVARQGVEGLLRKKLEIVPGWMNSFSASAVPFLPKSWVERIAEGIYEK